MCGGYGWCVLGYMWEEKEKMSYKVAKGDRRGGDKKFEKNYQKLISLKIKIIGN